MSGQFSHLILRFEVSLCLLLLQIKLILDEKLSHLKTNHPHSIGVVVPSNCKLSHWKPPLPQDYGIKSRSSWNVILVKLAFCILDWNIYFIPFCSDPKDLWSFIWVYQNVSKCTTTNALKCVPMCFFLLQKCTFTLFFLF